MEDRKTRLQNERAFFTALLVPFVTRSGWLFLLSRHPSLTHLSPTLSFGVPFADLVSTVGLGLTFLLCIPMRPAVKLFTALVYIPGIQYLLDSLPVIPTAMVCGPLFMVWIVTSNPRFD